MQVWVTFFPWEYRHAVGCLQYLVTCSHHDIAAPVSILSAYNAALKCPMVLLVSRIHERGALMFPPGILFVLMATLSLGRVNCSPLWSCLHVRLSTWHFCQLALCKSLVFSPAHCISEFSFYSHCLDPSGQQRHIGSGQESQNQVEN